MSKEATPEEKAIREEWVEGSCDGISWTGDTHNSIKLCLEEFARNVLERYKEDERRTGREQAIKELKAFVEKYCVCKVNGVQVIPLSDFKRALEEIKE